MTIRYVAIGDSFTEGVGDEYPDGTPRGWADRLAEKLAEARGEPIHYANLAIRGRCLGPIVEEQLEAALALDPGPTHLSLHGGGNDFLHARIDERELVELVRHVVCRCNDEGVRPVLLSGADPSSRLPFGRVFHQRAADFTVATKRVAEELGAAYIDVFNDAAIRDAHYWSPDRLHLNPAGHARVAHLVLREIGLDSGEIETPPGIRHSRGALAEARYYREYVWPWVARRLTGRSTGDNITAKFAEWKVFEPARG